MNWEQIKGNWNQLKGDAKKRWGKLTNDEIDQMEGDRDKMVGIVQERYGIAKEEADKQVRDWETSL